MSDFLYPRSPRAGKAPRGGVRRRSVGSSSLPVDGRGCGHEEFVRSWRHTGWRRFQRLESEAPILVARACHCASEAGSKRPRSRPACSLQLFLRTSGETTEIFFSEKLCFFPETHGQGGTMLESTLESATSVRLLKKAFRHPLRAVNGLVEIARVARMHETQERDAAVAFLSNTFETDVRSILRKHERSGIGAWMRRRQAQLKDFPGPYRLGATPTFDCDTIYLLVRC